MEWLTEYFEMLLPVALVLMFLFQRLFIRDEGEGGPRPPQSEIDEEARRIQDEIRRKIIARQQGRVEPAEAQERSLLYREEEAEPPVGFPRHEEEPASFWPEPDRPLIVEQPAPVWNQERRAAREATASGSRDLQDELRIQKERLEEARRAKEEALQDSSARGLRDVVVAPLRRVRSGRRVGGSLRGQLLEDLNASQSLRRAFLLKEVLDRPIGLRPGGQDFANWV